MTPTASPGCLHLRFFCLMAMVFVIVERYSGRQWFDGYARWYCLEVQTVFCHVVWNSCVGKMLSNNARLSDIDRCISFFRSCLEGYNFIYFFLNRAHDSARGGFRAFFHWDNFCPDCRKNTRDKVSPVMIQQLSLYHH